MCICSSLHIENRDIADHPPGDLDRIISLLRCAAKFMKREEVEELGFRGRFYGLNLRFSLSGSGFSLLRCAAQESMKREEVESFLAQEHSEGDALRIYLTQFQAKIASTQTSIDMSSQEAMSREAEAMQLRNRVTSLEERECAREKEIEVASLDAQETIPDLCKVVELGLNEVVSVKEAFARAELRFFGKMDKLARLAVGKVEGERLRAVALMDRDRERDELLMRSVCSTAFMLPYLQAYPLTVDALGRSLFYDRA